MKTIEFKVENLSISRGNGYGQYYVTATVNGDKIKAHTTNSEAFDWFNDDENLEKHEEAQEYCHDLAVRTWENLK